MAENKRYYWFKMKTNFFDNLIIKYLKAQKKGDNLIITFIKIMLISLENDGYIKYNKMFPTFEEELALATGEKLDVIRFLLPLLIKFGAVEKQENDVYYIKMLTDNIGSETADALRKRKAKNGNLPENFGNLPPETEKDKETDKELYLEKNASSFSYEKKGGSYKRKNNFYNNGFKERKPASYDIDEVMRQVNEVELVYDPNKKRKPFMG